MKLYLFTLMLILFISTSLKAQKVQYASEVLEYSSQYTHKKFSANQILGRPSTLPDGTFYGNTWAAAGDAKDAFIKVGFKHAMRIRQVAIFEFHRANSITEVYAYDIQGKSHRIYKGNAKNIGQHKRTFRITIPLTDYEVKALKIVFDFADFENKQNHIDAVGISDSDQPLEAEINLAEGTDIIGTPVHLGADVNTGYSELLPIISSDGKSMFFVRHGYPENMEGVTNENSGDIYYSEMKDGKWTKAVNAGAPLNNKGNNAVFAVSPDGNNLLLVGQYFKDGSFDIKAGLSMSRKTKKGWSFPELLNIKNFYTQTSINNYFLADDWKTLILCIERDDSYGEADFYVSFREGDNTWTEPKHMGPQLNTSATDFAPFLAPDGKTFYFSSWVLPGYGAADMFMSKRLDDTWQNWSEPVNMGPAINTSGFDSYYKITADGKHAYFVSTLNAIGGSDIFAMELPQALKPEPVVMLSGKVLNAKTKAPLEASIKYEILNSAKESGETNSDPSTGYYSIVLPYGHNYGYYASAKGYIAITENIDLSELNEYTEIVKDIYLVPIEVGQTIQLNNVFFQRGLPELIATSYPELDRMVKVMSDNPSIEIELMGHTDNVGSAEKNQILSEQRVDAVKKYLVDKGISGKRISGKGFGGSKPIAPNDSEQNRQKNRRVEFVIKKS